MGHLAGKNRFIAFDFHGIRCYSNQGMPLSVCDDSLVLSCVADNEEKSKSFVLKATVGSSKVPL